MTLNPGKRGVGDDLWFYLVGLVFGVVIGAGLALGFVGPYL